MQGIPNNQQELTALLHRMFTPAEFSGVTMRQLLPADSAPITVIYVQGLVEPQDLERLVLVPLSLGGLGKASPKDLARSCRFPAPALRVAEDAKALRAGLMTGLVALHVEGYPAVLLVGSGRPIRMETGFTANLEANLALIAGHLMRPDLRMERLDGADGASCVVTYVDSEAQPEIVRGVKDWCRTLTPHPGRSSRWQAALASFRLPPTVESTTPAAVAAALQRGYVAVLTDYRTYPLVAPTTLEQLLTGPKDVTLLPYVRRLASAPRIVAAVAGLTLGGALVAVTGYHHSLIPGPFLVALAASRQNNPFPIVLEVLGISLLGDAATSVAIRAGGTRITLIAWIGIVASVMAGMQVGVIGAVSGTASIVALLLRLVVPNPTLGLVIREWRYLFLAAAAGFGLYGMTLLGFLLMVYLGEERAFGHPIRLPVQEVKA